MPAQRFAELPVLGRIVAVITLLILLAIAGIVVVAIVKGLIALLLAVVAL